MVGYSIAKTSGRAYGLQVSTAGRYSERLAANAVVSAPPKGDGAGHVQKINPVGENRLLQRLGAEDLARLAPDLKEISMVRGTVLHMAGEPIAHVYFPMSGMISILAVMRTGEQIETAIVGREGVVGASIGSDGSQSAGQATVQIEGSARQVQAAKFLELHRASEPFRTLMNRFQNVMLLQAQQSAACHALHPVEARLCRWLLQSQDVTGSDLVPLTQEFLSHMLGVQRTSVSLCAHALQKAGLIKYSRGQIKVLDRRGLQEAACECYEVVRDFVDKAVPPLS